MSSAVPSKRPAPVDIQQQIAEARKRAEEVKARLEAQKAAKGLANGANGSNGAAAPAPPKTAAELARERVEALKARVAAATARAKGDDPPPRPAAQPNSWGAQPPPPPPETDDISRSGGRGGLSIGIHPRLLADTQDGAKTARYDAKPKPQAKEDERSNPYLSEVGPGPGGRTKRTLHFNHNLHARPAMQAANEMRRKAAIDAMKKRIQASVTKAGVDESAEIQAFTVAMPPEVEFWDEGLQAGIENNEFISKLVVHPIMIEPPQEKYITLKPAALKLTKKETKKMRRIRRAEEHREEQAKIRLGLMPTPAPKIKHSNVMRVYGDMAVKDPTAVEAMVNKQVAERKDTHLEANASRQLTKEEKAAKIAQKAKENAAMGLNVSVYKIALGKDQLLGKHKFKIDMNAKQYSDVTGVCIVAPSLTLCVIQGGDHSTRKLKHLLLNRTKWQAILRGEGEVQNDAFPDDEKEQDNTCTLLHQGLIRNRTIKKWGSFRDVESDSQAKDVLSRFKMEHLWTLAKTSSA
ncbi:PRP3-domain-containing protein [Microthyrium microscopicum]|uniref:PRP3-domain-containing protein n=1 Tax=Microthyrium microscopicum TaxID=703497 RepID=A0A6A6TXM2_9PEZI|nr:PRP3-domain-containing protein [Microthyrium microscopicum]